MSFFSVPKTVNSHVLNAVTTLSGGNTKKRLPMALILNEVKFQMQNLTTVPNIELAVQNSLMDLSDLGLIERLSLNRFAIGRLYAPPTPTRRWFKPTGSRKRSYSDLDPNIANNRQSDDSLSGDDFDRTRKRLRSNNKKLRSSGRGVELPKARQHYSRPREYDFDNNFYASGEPYWGRATELDEDEDLLCDYNSNMDVMPVRSLEIIEVSSECSNSDIQRQTKEKANQDTRQIRISDENAADEMASCQNQVSVDMPASSPRTIVTAAKNNDNTESFLSP